MVVIGSATSGHEAVEIAIRERPAIILMDIQMPIMEGFEAPRRILAAFPACVIFLTAYVDEEYLKQVREIGNVGLIVKPVDHVTVIQHLQEEYLQYCARSSEPEGGP